MNKGPLSAAIAEQLTITKANASKAIDAIFNAIQDSLKKGGPVSFVGFV